MEYTDRLLNRNIEKFEFEALYSTSLYPLSFGAVFVLSPAFVWNFSVIFVYDVDKKFSDS